LANSLNPKSTPKIPRSWEKSQAVEALYISGILEVSPGIMYAK